MKKLLLNLVMVFTTVTLFTACGEKSATKNATGNSTCNSTCNSKCDSTSNATEQVKDTTVVK